MNPMNTVQEIFVVFFAIFWGTLSNVWPSHKPFHWPPIAHHEPVFNRLVLSLILLNIVPIIYFWLTFRSLSNSVSNVVAPIVAAFPLFGFYRLWLAAVERFPRTYYYYNKEALPDDMKGIEPVFECLHPQPQYWIGNLLSGLLYIAAGILAVLLAKKCAT